MTVIVRHRLAAATMLVCIVVGWVMALPPTGPSTSAAQMPKAPARPGDLLGVAADMPVAVADLFRSLASPADLLVLTDGETLEVEPVGADSLLDPDFAGTLTVKVIATPDRGGGPLELSRAAVARYKPYEQLALAHIEEFEKVAKDLPLVDRLAAAEKALAVVLRFSLGERLTPLRGQTRWEPMQAELERKLLAVRRGLLRQRAAATRSREEWNRVVKFGDELVAAYPGNNAILTDVAQLRVRAAAAVLLRLGVDRPAAQDYAEIRRQLAWVNDHFVQPPRPLPLDTAAGVQLQFNWPVVQVYRPDAEAVRQVLEGRAAALMTQAKRTPDKVQAIKLLRAAVEIWPALPGLRDELLRLGEGGTYAILRVGVRTLPRFLSPDRAVVDAELQAQDLLFEGLVQAQPTRDGSQAYFPQLAASLPKVTENERHFSIRKNAYWSNGARVTSADVQRTFELLTSPKLSGHSLELTDQFEPLRSGTDAFRWSVKLQKGLLDPLLPFTFKVLPREYRGAPLVSANAEAFAQAPVGSGRYMLAEHGSNFMRFVANPFYQGRNELDGPKIREVHFVVSNDPVADFANKAAPLHMLLDVSATDAARLKAAGVAKLRTLATRRIFFLAVNHREPLLADEALRRALAHGLDRDQLLADSFGGGRPSFRAGAMAVWGSTAPVLAAARAPAGTSVHRGLNGPYPADSWACNPEVPAKLCDRSRAAAFLKKAGSSKIELELKYPDDDPRVAQACRAIAGQLADVGSQAGCSVKLRLVARTPHELQRDLQSHQYQLAYWHYDFPSDAYSLWPLFDPRPEALANGSNYLGFKDKEGSLPALLLQAASYRDFNEVKRTTHLFHLLVADRMPLIPLWQFNCHIAVHPSLELPAIDPLRVFANIDEWPLPAGR